jgi:hypothetical protein
VQRLVAFLVLAIVPLAGCANTGPSHAPTGPATGGHPAYVVPDVPKVDAADLLADHAAFVTKNNERRDNLPTHLSARVDLLDHFRSYNLDAQRLNFTDGIPQADILGIKWGVQHDKWVVVGGHYDTTQWDCFDSGLVTPGCALHTTSQGAYDDGSGTMIAVHLAKAYANVTPYYTIVFVAYDGEERGIQGARAFVDQITSGNSTFGHVTIVGDLDIDMFGINWPGTNAPINLMSNSQNATSLIDAKRKEMGVPDDQFKVKAGLKLGSSDYSAFWRVSDPAPIPTVFFISDFEELGTPSPAPDAASTPFGAYPFWHFQDTVETMTAMAGGAAQLQAGFQTAADLTAYVVHFMACEPGTHLDATPQ